MKALVLGGGGREHAIAWKIRQSWDCDAVFAMPGNPGTAQVGTNIAGDPNDFQAVKKAVLDNAIDIVVVGPEEPLVRGLGDRFSEDSDLKGVMFVGPGAAGAALEGSKQFAKEFMARHGIPTAAFRSFKTDQLAQAQQFLRELKPPYVLKADGLAGGKGVLICNSLEQADSELKEMLGGKFGKASSTVVIEEFLSGIEVSMFILTDGKSYLLLPEAKDYKRIGDGDTGLNTGGMGAVSPVPFVDEEFKNKVRTRIIEPTLKGLEEEGISYKGFIFLGLMNCGGEPYVIEYNVRMGDPETEAVMTRIDSDLLSHLCACAKGTLDKETMDISDDAALTVVCVSGGYPGSYPKGKAISGDPILFNNSYSGPVKVFHSGTAEPEEGLLVTSGGRVLAVTSNTPLSTSVKETIEEGRSLAYSHLERIEFEGKYFRKDIGLDIIRYKEGK
ncbi:MAG: phosphoribosylamine--glycine ligase [Bacteroidales bacterium]|nr:phosphoribosylamine--glycine ligase [Bacteroidales bacterium]